MIDVSNLPAINTLGSIGLQGRSIAHNTWPSADDNVCATTNESSGGPTGFYFRLLPILLRRLTFCLSPSTIFVRRSVATATRPRSLPTSTGWPTEERFFIELIVNKQFAALRGCHC